MINGLRFLPKGCGPIPCSGTGPLLYNNPVSASFVTNIAVNRAHIMLGTDECSCLPTDLAAFSWSSIPKLGEVTAADATSVLPVSIQCLSYQPPTSLATIFSRTICCLFRAVPSFVLCCRVHTVERKPTSHISLSLPSFRCYFTRFRLPHVISRLLYDTLRSVMASEKTDTALGAESISGDVTNLNELTSLVGILTKCI